MIDLIKGVIKSRSVVFSEIADKIDKDIKATSIERRIQDFFQKTTSPLKNPFPHAFRAKRETVRKVLKQFLRSLCT